MQSKKFKSIEYRFVNSWEKLSTSFILTFLKDSYYWLTLRFIGQNINLSGNIWFQIWFDKYY